MKDFSTVVLVWEKLVLQACDFSSSPNYNCLSEKKMYFLAYRSLDDHLYPGCDTVRSTLQF